MNALHCFKAVSQINVYHFLQQKMQIMIMIKNNKKNNEK